MKCEVRLGCSRGLQGLSTNFLFSSEHGNPLLISDFYFKKGPGCRGESKCERSWDAGHTRPAGSAGLPRIRHDPRGKETARAVLTERFFVFVSF